MKKSRIIVVLLVISVIVSMLSLVNPVNASSSVVTKSPFSTVGGINSWTNPTYAYSDGSNAATDSSNGNSQKYSGFGFNILSTVTITSVKVGIDAWHETNDNIKLSVSVDGGSNWISTTSTPSLTTSEATYWVDVTSWTSWTPAKLNSDKIWTTVTHVKNNGADQVSLDWIRIEVTFTQASSSTSTALSSSTITYGASLTDTATVTAGASGNVKFEVSTDGTNFAQYCALKALSGGNPNTATSAQYTPATAGTYYFKAVYSGDSNYLTSASGNTAEPLTVGKVSPSIGTTAPVSAMVGFAFHDSATLTGATSTAAGTVTYTLYKGTSP
jgi:hypothetical protein